MTTNRSVKQEQPPSPAKTLIPLLKIPQAHVEIFTDCIVVYSQQFAQPKTADTGEFMSITDCKLDEAGRIEHERVHSCRVGSLKEEKPTTIKFSNPDFAFNIDQQEKRVQIHDLLKHSVPLKFKVSSLQTLLTIQSLLRRKMCELGFETKYRIVKALGKGATAVVNLVERVSDRKLFAAKVISIKEANDKSYQTFINESKLLRILKHRNIINLQSLYIHKKELIQVIEYLSGGTLLHAIKNDQLKERKEKWKVLRDLTYGLDYLRQRRIVHRDIKMENILIRMNGDKREYVISDFGLASWIGEKNPLFQRCGTPGYIAPEVLNSPKGKPILNHKIDIFSLGAIAHVVFLHQPLFPYTGNIKDLLKLNKKAQYTFEGYPYEDLTLSEMNFLEMTLSKDPNLRASANEIIDQIRYISQDFVQVTPQKSGRISSHQKVKVDDKKYGIEVQVKKATSLTKNKINLSQNRDEKSNSNDKKPMGSARKLFSDLWTSLTSPSPKKENLRVKQNSIQKQKKLSQYFQ